MSSVNPDAASAVEHMSLYRYITMLEKKRKISKYVFSHTEIQRKKSSDEDGFDVKLKDAVKFVCVVTDPNGQKPKTTAKTFWFEKYETVEKSPVLTTVVRWKYERVQSISKIAKPYIVLSQPLTLKPGCPLKVMKFLIIIRSEQMPCILTFLGISRKSRSSFECLGVCLKGPSISWPRLHRSRLRDFSPTPLIPDDS
jgi:hypothetical protein